MLEGAWYSIHLTFDHFGQKIRQAMVEVLEIVEFFTDAVRDYEAFIFLTPIYYLWDHSADCKCAIITHRNIQQGRINLRLSHVTWNISPAIFQVVCEDWKPVRLHWLHSSIKALSEGQNSGSIAIASELIPWSLFPRGKLHTALYLYTQFMRHLGCGWKQSFATHSCW